MSRSSGERGRRPRAAGRTAGTGALLRACRLAGLVLVLGSAPAAAENDENDPLEPVNRAVFQFNRVVDGMFLEPSARLYRMLVPRLARRGIENGLTNLRSPVVLANDMLQGNWERAEVTFGRLMINTLAGFGGLVDTATWAGMPAPHDEDFGQTLAVYGVTSGPYLMLPLFGPSNPRDAAGRVIDILLDPFALLAPTDANIGRTTATAVTFREANIETVEELERTSLDLYAATRTLFRQLRANEIRNGSPAPIEDIYDESIYDELTDPAEAGPAQ